MDKQALTAMCEEFEAELAQVAAAVRAGMARESHLRSVVTGLRGLLNQPPGATPQMPMQLPDPTTPAPETASQQSQPQEDAPRGIEAVREVLRQVGTEMNTREITEHLIQRGWAPLSRDPLNATSSNAARAAEVLPEVQRRRTDRGIFLYKYVAPITPPTGAAQPSDSERHEQEVVTP